jgi:PAS domain S-box-containing protein
MEGSIDVSPRRLHRAERAYLRQLLSPAFALAAIAIIEAFSWTPWQIVAPTTLLLTAVVASTFVGGLVDGLISAGITVWYYSYLLSSPGTVFPYTHETLRRVLVYACSAPAVALMVGVIKQRAARIAADAARRERDSSDAVYASLTWSREAEKTGREAERRYRAFFDANVAGIVHAFRDGKMLVCNEAFRRLTGFSTDEEIKARNIRDFFEERADFDRIIERLDRGTLSIEEELGFRRRDRDLRRVRLTARRLEEGARLVVEVSVVDITAQWTAQTQAAALETKMATQEAYIAILGQEVDALAHAVAHDLRGPLRRMDDLSEALIVDYGLRLDGEGRGRLNRLATTNRSMEKLVQRFIELSRLTSGELKRERVDLSALARGVAEGLRAGHAGDDVTCTIAPGLTANGDPGLLRLALTHLIGTAWSATAGQPGAHIEFGSARVGDRETFVITDGGGTIDRPYAGALPGAVQRLDNGHGPEGRHGPDGGAVALVMVQRVIQRHGGRVWVEATPEGGAVFFTLGNEPEKSPPIPRISPASL